MPTVATNKLAEALVAQGLLKPEEIKQMQRIAQSEQRSLEQVLVMRKVVDEGALYNLISDLIGVPYVDLSTYNFDSLIIKMVRPEVARKFKAIPLFKIGDTLSVAMTNPNDIIHVDQLRGKVGQKIEPYLCGEAELSKVLDQFYPSSGMATLVQELGEEEPKGVPSAQGRAPQGMGVEGDEGNPVVKLLNVIMEQAVHDGVSDIHMEPEKDIMRVRFRIDGVLHEIPSPPKHLESAIVSRIKVISEMDIAENRIPQDGRFRSRIEGKDIDVRVSTLPTTWGENVVMRLLDSSSLNIGLENLGFGKNNLEALTRLIKRPYGLILVTGPTGSGKTTTLYAALQTINTADKHIVTIEDPVEYQLELVRQTQVNAKAGLTFANGLRSIMRHDPDVIMVGEIRDLETAEIAVQSAMTGHLVFSTLHTNDAPGSITRLNDMGTEPFLISSSVIGVVAQRLVRRICDKCKEGYTLSDKVITEFGLTKTKAQVYRGKGCRYCKDTGYKGRVAIAEIMEVNEEIKKKILVKASAAELRQVAEATGMRGMKQDGLEKVTAGLTTVEEIARVTELKTEEETGPVKPIVLKPMAERAQRALKPARPEKLDVDDYQKRISGWLARK